MKININILVLLLCGCSSTDKYIAGAGGAAVAAAAVAAISINEIPFNDADLNRHADDFYNQFRSARRILNLEESSLYVQSILDDLIKSNNLPKNKVVVRLYDDPFPSAFTPGAKYIFLSTGLLSLTQNPDQLAFILAHELAHILEKHRFSKSVINSAFHTSTALGLSSIAAGARTLSHDEKLGIGLIAVGLIASGGSFLLQPRVNKLYEDAADKAAAILIQRSSFSPNHISSIFGILAAADGNLDKDRDYIKDQKKLQEAQSIYKDSRKQNEEGRFQSENGEALPYYVDSDLTSEDINKSAIDALLKNDNFDVGVSIIAGGVLLGTVISLNGHSYKAERIGLKKDILEDYVIFYDYNHFLKIEKIIQSDVRNLYKFGAENQANFLRFLRSCNQSNSEGSTKVTCLKVES